MVIPTSCRHCALNPVIATRLTPQGYCAGVPVLVKLSKLCAARKGFGLAEHNVAELGTLGGGGGRPGEQAEPKATKAAEQARGQAREQAEPKVSKGEEHARSVIGVLRPLQYRIGFEWEAALGNQVSWVTEGC